MKYETVRVQFLELFGFCAKIFNIVDFQQNTGEMCVSVGGWGRMPEYVSVNGYISFDC